jgi:hypothetical protein
MLSVKRTVKNGVEPKLPFHGKHAPPLAGSFARSHSRLANKARIAPRTSNLRPQVIPRRASVPATCEGELAYGDGIWRSELRGGAGFDGGALEITPTVRNSEIVRVLESVLSVPQKIVTISPCADTLFFEVSRNRAYRDRARHVR